MQACVLVVEDQSGDLKAQCKALESVNFAIEASSSLSGVQSLLDDGIDCIHMDIDFPAERPRDGLDTIAEIRDRYPETPVMVISGYLDEAHHQKARNLDLSGTVRRWYDKPFDYEIIAFDTIKCINEEYFKRNVKELEKRIGDLGEESEVLRNALRTMAPCSYPLELDERLLLRKMRSLAGMIDSYLEAGKPKLVQRAFNDFKHLVTEHAGDFFFAKGLGRELLVDHLHFLVTHVDLGQISEVFGNRLASAVLALEDEEISEERVWNLRRNLESAANIHLGPVFGSSGDIRKYLDTIDDGEGEFEK